MRREKRHIVFGLLATTWIAMLGASCDVPTEKISDESAGLNGGFEIARDGLPVNWAIYMPRGAESDFRTVLDPVLFKEGHQSLKFDVARIGDRPLPGFTNEFIDVGRYRGPAKYRIEFWARNEGTEFVVSGGPVSAKDGDMRVLVRDDAPLDEWTPFEFVVDVPDDQWLRLQLSLLTPGSFWIDDVRIDKVS